MLLSIPVVDPMTCSREGAGLAAGIAMLIGWAALTIAVTVAIAIVSGVVVGSAKRRIGRQVAIHLAWAVGFLVLLPFVIGGSWTVYLAWQGWNIARATTEYDAWLAPLRHPVAGEFDRALKAVMEAKDADSPTRRTYLIAALPHELEQLDGVTLDDRERAAFAAVVRQLRTENVERKLGSHESNLELLDSAVTWFSARPDLVAALRACDVRRQCRREVLDAAGRWCWRNGQACKAAVPPKTIAEAVAMFSRGEEDDVNRVKGFAGLADEAIARSAKSR
jgi:hypothetical protein